MVKWKLNLEWYPDYRYSKKRTIVIHFRQICLIRQRILQVQCRQWYPKKTSPSLWSQQSLPMTQRMSWVRSQIVLGLAVRLSSERFQVLLFKQIMILMIKMIKKKKLIRLSHSAAKKMKFQIGKQIKKLNKMMIILSKYRSKLNLISRKSRVFCKHSRILRGS